MTPRDPRRRAIPGGARPRRPALAFAPAAIVAASVAAQDDPLPDLPEPVDPEPPALEVGSEDEDRGRRWTLGAGADYLTTDDPDESDGIEPFPIVELAWGRFSFFPVGAAVELLEWSPAPPEGEDESPWALLLGAAVEIGIDETDGEAGTVREGMRARGDDTPIALDAELVSPVGVFVLSAETDVGGGSGGRAASIGWGVPLPTIGRVESFALVGVRHESADLVAHEVGVDPDEARAGRPAYAPGAATTPYLELGAEVALGRGVSLFATAGHSRVPDERRDSPLTDDDESASAFGLGVSWSF